MRGQGGRITQGKVSASTTIFTYGNKEKKLGKVGVRSEDNRLRRRSSDSNPQVEGINERRVVNNRSTIGDKMRKAKLLPSRKRWNVLQTSTGFACRGAGKETDKLNGESPGGLASSKQGRLFPFPQKPSGVGWHSGEN